MTSFAILAFSFSIFSFSFSIVFYFFRFSFVFIILSFSFSLTNSLFSRFSTFSFSLTKIRLYSCNSVSVFAFVSQFAVEISPVCVLCELRVVQRSTSRMHRVLSE